MGEALLVYLYTDSYIESTKGYCTDVFARSPMYVFYRKEFSCSWP